MRVSSASASSGDLSPVAPQFATDEEAEAYDYWFRQKVQISLKDQRPTASHEEVMTTLRKIIETKHDISGSDPMRS
ncbi:stability determinant [Rugamonas sp. FT82W]|uniref:Stability determinant n=2 Tax=Duganella vulcania TaxID=2692166 RepID=A0A845FZT7_9BURK|nr:stability determinant [Duganella vulcania]